MTCFLMIPCAPLGGLPPPTGFACYIRAFDEGAPSNRLRSVGVGQRSDWPGGHWLATGALVINVCSQASEVPADAKRSGVSKRGWWLKVKDGVSITYRVTL
jgi:hypothetical protein